MTGNPFLCPGNWDIFDDSDGLGHQAFCLLQHSDGHLWIGTAEGLSRYDGRRFESYSRGNGIEGQVLALCEDGSGNLWLGTSLGLVCYDGRTFRTFRALPELRRFVVRAIQANDDGTILCGTDVSGTFLFDGREFRRFGIDAGARGELVRAVFRGSDGHVWVGSNLGLAEYNESRCVLYTVNDGIGAGTVLAIHQDAQGSIWCGSEDGGLSCLGRDGVVTFTIKDGLPDNSVTAILPYRGGMLCSTLTSLCWFDGREFVRIGVQPGPTGRAVTAMALDREGGLWVANSHAGIARYNGDRLTTLAPFRPCCLNAR
jgi:ligand-binding sensor domain-containing protein